MGFVLPLGGGAPRRASPVEGWWLLLNPPCSSGFGSVCRMDRKNREFLSGEASASCLPVQPHQSWVMVLSLCLQRMLLLGEANAPGGLVHCDL